MRQLTQRDCHTQQHHRPHVRPSQFQRSQPPVAHSLMALPISSSFSAFLYFSHTVRYTTSSGRRPPVLHHQGRRELRGVFMTSTFEFQVGYFNTTVVRRTYQVGLVVSRSMSVYVVRTYERNSSPHSGLLFSGKTLVEKLSRP